MVSPCCTASTRFPNAEFTQKSIPNILQRKGDNPSAPMRNTGFPSRSILARTNFVLRIAAGYRERSGGGIGLASNSDGSSNLNFSGCSAAAERT